MNAKALIEKHQLTQTDTGSSAVQIILLSDRISYLTEHLKVHKKDFHSTRGLLLMTAKRRSLLQYLKRKNPAKCEQLAQDLHLRKSSH